MDRSFIFLYFFFLSAALYFLVVPKQEYKKTIIYGIIFGGIGDTLLVPLLSSLGLIKYKNMGFFNILDIYSSWTPVTWTLIFALFFYLLPVRIYYVIPIVLAFASFTYGVGLVFQNFGVFEYIGFYKYVAPFLFLAWYSVAAWVYLRNNNLALK